MKKIFFVLALVLTGCSLVVANPEVVLKDTSLVGLDSDGATIEFLLAVTNPNSFQLKLRGYHYDLKVMDLPLTQGGVREVIDFAGGSTTDVRLPVRITYQDLVELIKRRPDPEHIPYQLVASLELEMPIGSVAIPVEKSGTFAVPQQYRFDRYLKTITDFFSTLTTTK